MNYKHIFAISLLAGSVMPAAAQTVDIDTAKRR